ncbi:phage tail protein [Plesiomonas shigelloides]|uniref:Phage tail protein n=1 Tax=Plesiomonas shigelloides TaxID=703 RepID=A0A8I2B2G6_PLESH|nr:phage tail protein [Plesiomonas shigelloides]MBO1107906.1 phage tail protein [Plesiomonas shigelloides]
MSQSAITLAFENYKAQEATNGQVLKLNEFVLANVPGLDPSLPVDRNETVPSDEYIVHRQAVSKEGVVNQNTVAYSITMGSDVGDFDFNWLGLRNKETGLLGMVVHVPTQRKIATAAGQQGNALTRSFLMEYEGAAEATGITTPAETWQIDFTDRLFGIDDTQRLVNRDLYGDGAFFGDGFLVVSDGSQYKAIAGVGYIGGVRAELSRDQSVSVDSLPTKIWTDVSYQGSVTSDWKAEISLTVADTMVDYVDTAGFAHYVFAVAAIDDEGRVTDLRPKGSVLEQESQNAIKELNDALIKHEQSRNHPDASLTEKGMAQYSNAVDSDAENKASTAKATKIVMDNANARLAKARNLSDLENPALACINLGLSETMAKAEGALQKVQNGADIEDKLAFIRNLGLDETLNPSKRVCIGPVGVGPFDGSKPAINVGDSGFVNSTSGRLDIYSGGLLVGYVDATGLHFTKSIHTSERVCLGDSIVNQNADLYGACWGGWLSGWLSGQFAVRDSGINARATIDYVNQQLVARDNNINSRSTWDYVNQTFVRRLRRGSIAVGSNEAEAPAGCFTTMVIRTQAWYRPLQMNINGGWYNVDG